MCKMKFSGILSLLCYTLTAYASVCMCRHRRSRKTPASMDDVFGMMLRGDGKVTKSAYVPHANKSTQEESGSNEFEDLFSSLDDKVKDDAKGDASDAVSQDVEYKDHSQDSEKHSQSEEGNEKKSDKGTDVTPDGQGGDHHIKPHGSDDEKTSSGDLDNPVAPQSRSSHKEAENQLDLLPETVTDAEINPLSSSTDDDDTLEDIIGDISNGKASQDITLYDLVNSQKSASNVVSSEKEVKPLNPSHHKDLDSFDVEDVEAPGIDDDFSLDTNYKNDEKRHSMRKAHKRRQYKKFVSESQPPQDVLEEEASNAGLAAAIKYLGSGYDIVFGNPLGDPTIMVDPGYRNPVLKLDWTDEFHNHDGTNIKEPRGTWIRPELSCRQAESVDHVNTVEEYKKELSVDAQLSADIPFYFSFSASAGYKNFVKTISANVTKCYILKTYCLRYVAGIHDLKNVDTLPSFKADVLNLPDTLDTDRCPMEKYRNNEEDLDCQDTIKPWMKFFQKYGTHYTTIIHLGGKVTNQIQMKKMDVASLQKNGYNIDAVVKSSATIPFLSLGEGSMSSNGEVNSESKKNSISHDKLVIVIGGDVPTDGTDKVSMKEWTQSLYKKPMPIKVNLESIKTLITEEKKKNLFDNALKYYSELYGISPDEMYKSEGRERGVASLAMNGHPVVYEGRSGGSAVCPQNKVIMMGFALSITRKSKIVFSDVKYTTSIAPCPVGKEKCVASVPNGDADVRIWILCGEETIPLLIQETKISDNGPASATCPSDYSIAFGFGMSIPKSLQVTLADCYACRAGQSTCTHSSNKPGRNVVWIACVEKNAPELSDITNHAVAVSTPACAKNKPTDYKDNVCPPHTALITGWEMHIAKNKNDASSKMRTCPASSLGCKLDKHFQTQHSSCKAQFSWVSCYNPPALSGKAY